MVSSPTLTRLAPLVPAAVGDNPAEGLGGYRTFTPADLGAGGHLFPADRAAVSEGIRRWKDRGPAVACPTRPQVVGCPPEHREAAERLIADDDSDDDDSWLDDLIEKGTPPGPRTEFEKVTDNILAGLKADHRTELAASTERMMDQLLSPPVPKMWTPTRPIVVDATVKAGFTPELIYPPGLIESAAKDATGLPVKFGRTGVTVGHVSSVDATGRATISFKEGCEVLAEWAQRGMLEPITGESMTADAVTIEAQPATRRQEKGRMVHSQPNGWQIKVDRTQTPRSGRLTSPVLVGASATVGDFTGPLVAYDAQYDTWYEVGEAIVAAIRTGPDGSMDVEADTFGEFHSTLSPESAASARAAGMQAGLAHEQRVMDAFLAATAEGIGDVLVSDRGMVYLPPADPDAPHVVTGGES